MNRISFKSLACFVLTFVFAVSSTTAFADIKNRKTQTLMLDNHLGVLLISDPDVDRSAAGLSVGVGHLYDPKNKMGLAHYLEHMLFLGTEKYPNVGSFKEFLNSHSGGSNAYTGSNITNYFFQVSHDGFEGALDRFSDFFRAPLFDAQYAEREVHAVDSEFEKNQLQDGWRASHLTNQVSVEGHPIRNFGIGNKNTLAGDNRPALLAFHKKYYSARIMKLAVLSKLPLSEMETLVRKYFADIPDPEVQLPEISPDYRRPLEGKYRLLRVKTIKDTRSISMEFPTIRLYDYPESKPASIVASVLGHEGKGSLLSKLKAEGLALGLSAGGGYSHPNLPSFGITVTLTPKGLAQYERVLEHVFSYIRLLKETGFKEYTYKENQAMAQIDFDWKTAQEGMGFMAGQAAQMQEFELEDVETLPYLFKKYEPEVYRAIIDTLKPENMLVTISSQNEPTDQMEHFFGTEYSLQEVGGASFEKLASPPPVAGMTYPDKNDFIPYDLKLVEDTTGQSEEDDPLLIRDNGIAKVWFKYDHRFQQPKVYLRYRIETPHVYDTADNLARSRLYEIAVQEGLNEITYPIGLAGLAYSLGIEKRGMTLSVGGYTERITDLLKLAVRNLKTIRIDEQKFANIKEAVIRQMQNRKMGQAFHRASYYNRQMWIVKQYTEDQLIAALKQVTLDDIRDYAKTLYQRVFVSGLIHGNWTAQRAEESVQLLLDELDAEPLPEAERYVEDIDRLKPGESLLFSHKVFDNNNAMYYVLQAGDKGVDRQARLSMISSIVESDFYTQMRTNQQLGYIVWSFDNRIEDRLFYKLVIQSADYGPFELQKRVQAWMADSDKLFDKVTDQQFENYQRSLIVSLEKKGDSIAEVAGELYYFAVEEKGDFQWKKKLVQAVKNLKKEEVVEAGKKLLQDPQVARSVILIRSNKNDDTVPEGVLTTLEQLKSRHTPTHAGVITH